METCNTSSPSSASRYFSGCFADLLLLFPSNVKELSDDITWLNSLILSEGEEKVIPCLGALGKAFERALITGCPMTWDITVFEPRSSGLPVFLGSLFELVLHLDGTPIFGFDAEKCCYSDAEGFMFPMPNEVLRSCADPVVAIRQVLLYFSKVEDIPVLADEEKEIESFVTRVTTGSPVSLKFRTPVIAKARQVLRDLLTPDGELHPSLAQWIDNPFGAHGPGAVFDGAKGKDKWRFSGFLGVDERIFASQYSNFSVADPNDLATTQVLKSRLSIVPKDFRAHRLICIEAKEAMFAQQGLWKVLEGIISSNASASSCIDFRDQEKSFRMSRMIHRYSTIDLKDASDGISLELAKLLLPKEVYRLLTRYRARAIELPDGQEVSQYRTLFTMGNALCFPTQTLIFWALAAGVFYSKRKNAARELRGHLRVFGDDVIIESEYAEDLCSVFVEAGLTVNFQKYCHNSLVRESCGSWFYGGIDARITKARILRPQQLRDWVSVVSNCRLLHERGFTEAAMALLECIQDIYPVPYGFFGLPGQRDCKKKAVRYNIQLQRMEYCMPVLRPEARLSRLDELVGLYSYFTGHGSRTVDRGDTPCVDWSWEVM